MKKAKNAFAIIGIVFAVIAAALLALHPVIDGIAAGLTEGASAAMGFPDYLSLLTERLGGLFSNFDWISNFSVETLKVYYPLLAGAVGVVLFIVLFIFLLCKKHAKGLGWFFPMLILFVLSIAVATVYVKPNDFFGAYSAKCTELGCSYNLISEGMAVNQLMALVGLCVALASAGFFILAGIFYIIYVCKARKNAKKVDSAREAALAKIESLLGGNN